MWRTARMRLTTLYGGLFLLCSLALLTVTWLLTARASLALRAEQMFGAAGGSGHQNLGELFVQSAIALAVVTVVALGLGWLVAGRVLRPLAIITASARRISATSLHERLALSGPDDELKELGDTLDDLFARLEAAFEAQRHFIANASHELRTPLTAERALLQVALGDPATPVSKWQAAGAELLASNTEQAQLIDALLTLASSEGGLDRHEPADLAAVAHTALAAPRPGIDELGLRVETAIEPAVFDGDVLLAERLLANLLDNAVQHNVAGGRVTVVTGSEDDRAVVSVTSTGPVIPAADVDRLFQPFQRLNGRGSRGADGHGLGLSIVVAIATAHGAAVSAQAPLDGGLSVTVTFPKAAG